MANKKLRLTMIWLLPIILVGGIFYPVLGYLVVGMMAFFLPLSYFKNRYWCGNLCPRGTFLDFILSKVGLKLPLPKIFSKLWFRWTVFFGFMAFLVTRLIKTGGNPIAIGAVFVTMCIVTTVLAIILGSVFKHRAWCAICPMGTLQEHIGKLRKTKARAA